MLSRADLEGMENILMEEVVRRRKLGEYNADAAAILNLAQFQLQIVQHLKEKSPRTKTAD